MRNSGDTLAQLINPEKYLKYARFMSGVDKVGFGNIGVSNADIVENIKIPEAFWLFCQKYDIDMVDGINMILRDFIIRKNHGNNRYEDGILNRLKNIDLPVETKKLIFKQIFNRSYTDGQQSGE